MIKESDRYTKMADIWLAASLESHGFIAEKHWRDNYEPMLRDYLPASRNFAWFGDDEQIYGFVSLNGTHIEALFVDPAMQGRGVGSELLDHAVHFAGVRSVVVYKKNTRALGFYLGRGFLVARERACEMTGETELELRL